MLELRDVTKSFGSVLAVRRTNLVLPPGETVVLIGPSGSGKSTILRMMIGLVVPDSGNVLVSGQLLTAGNVFQLRLHMGYVIQDGGLFPHLTARENVDLQARHLRLPASRIRERISELAVLTHFPTDALDRYPAQLSGGQKQRVSLMRALMLDPDILLLDEPLGALDPLIRADLQQDLRDIFQALKKTVVMVTHDLAEAAYFADRIVLLHEGRIVQDGTFSELCDEPADPFVTHFVNAQRAIHGTDSGGAG
jgi:osmoprotectant transport system ATP-binding protein